MAMPPAAQTPRCPCGQPWEAHELRCPRPKHRGIGRVIALAVAGGIAVQVFFVFALLAAAGLRHPLPAQRFSVAVPDAGPVQPALQACMMFYGWEGTHNTKFLNQAVADDHSHRVPWQFRPRFSTDLSRLRSSTREANYAHSSTTTYYEHNIEDDCYQATAGLNPQHRSRFREAFIRLTRPSTTSGRSVGSRRPGASG